MKEPTDDREINLPSAMAKRREASMAARRTINRAPRFRSDGPPRARITMSGSITYQPTSGPAATIGKAHEFYADGSEQPFSRQMKVTVDWKPIDKGWINSAVLIHLKNAGGNSPIELCAAGETFRWILHPGREMSGQPSSLEIFVRCQEGVGRLDYTLFPSEIPPEQG